MRAFQVEVWVKAHESIALIRPRVTGTMHELIIMQRNAELAKSAALRYCPGGEIRRCNEVHGPTLLPVNQWHTED